MLPRLARLLLAVPFLALPLHAQQSDSGTVSVTVRESMGMLEGFVLRAGNASARTDAAGRAQLRLPAGPRTLLLTRIGFVPRRLDVTVVADSTISVTIDVAMEDKM